jgi:hypothetical protein
MHVSGLEFMKDLPTKSIVKKRITDGRVGLAIKKIVWESRKTPIRKYPQKLLKSLGPNFKIPSYSTIEKFLIDSNLKHKVLLRKTLLRPANVEKRLLYALGHVSKDDQD